jgi:hypothetical protein
MIENVDHSLDNTFTLPTEAGRTLCISDEIGQRSGTVILSFRGHW